MLRTLRLPGLLLVATLLWTAVPAAAPPAESVDLDAVYRIKQEGFDNSQVMQILSQITDVHGPRLTGSPNLQAASEYVVELLAEWGIDNGRLEPWGEFGRGWENERFVAHVLEPDTYPVIGAPKAWTGSTDGPVIAEAVIAEIDDEEDFETLRGTLAGKILLTTEMPAIDAWWDAPARRLTDEELEERAAAPEPGGRGRGDFDYSRFRSMRELRDKAAEFFTQEGVVAILEPSSRGTGGTVFVGGGGSREVGAPEGVPQVVLTAEHYGRIWRTLEAGVPVRMELEVRNSFYEDDPTEHNVVAEIPGSDLADELVMLGAHFDSWHAGTGATDNAAGSAAMLEAMRILKAAGLQPRRTIRLALWTGEEQGLLGSRAYVKQHFADPEVMEPSAEHERFSAYFNLDNGTGAIRGVYLQENEAVRPLFAAWMEPFRDLGMSTLSIRNTGGTDHLAFDAVGLPGFQFIQDPIEYSTRTHHSNMDTYERLQESDMMKNAVIIAAFAYHAAMRDEPLPRKPLPEPQTGERPF